MLLLLAAWRQQPQFPKENEREARIIVLCVLGNLALRRGLSLSYLLTLSYTFKSFGIAAKNRIQFHIN